MRRRNRDEYVIDRGPPDLPHHRPGLERARGVLVFVFVALLFAEIFGVPHLRVSYTYTGSYSSPVYLSAEYWSITGPVDRAGGELPLIKIIPLEVPMRERARRAAGRFYAWAKNGIALEQEVHE